MEIQGQGAASMTNIFDSGGTRMRIKPGAIRIESGHPDRIAAISATRGHSKSNGISKPMATNARLPHVTPMESMRQMAKNARFSQVTAMESEINEQPADTSPSPAV